MKRVVITTLGCKVNQYESASFRTSFIEAGYQIVKSGNPADVVVVNTCAVTAKAGAQSRQSVRQSIRNNPDAQILITGCYAEIGAEQLTKLKELDGRQYSIIGNSKKDQLVPTAITFNSDTQTVLLGAIDQAKEICRLPVRDFGDRTRAYLRVQDGCESFCTYCIVPFTRGPSRSLPVEEVLEQARVFAQEGYRELVLTGIHLGYYGRDLSPQNNITNLIDKLTQVTPNIRYRISSLEPTEITDELLDIIKHRDNLAPHFHIPLQSGDDEILSKMNRKYTTTQFRTVIEKCLNTIPDAALGIDILAGFPGESEQHFHNTRQFLASLPLTYLHVFPYSSRPGTVAADFRDDVTKTEKDSRVADLRMLGESKRNDFYQRQLNTIKPVLVEGKRDLNGLLKGFSDNYVPVHFSGDDNLKNSVVNVRLEQFKTTHVIGKVPRDDES